MFGHRSIYHDGWRAVCPWPGPSFTEAGKPFGAPISAEMLVELDAHGWELYHVAEDIAENHNVAAENRERLIEMIATGTSRQASTTSCPSTAVRCSGLPRSARRLRETRTRYTYYPDTQTVPCSPQPKCSTAPTASPPMSRSRRAARRACCSARAQVRAAMPSTSRTASCTMSTTTSAGHFQVESVEPVPEGRHELRFEFEPTGKPDIPKGKGAPGRGQLYIDGKLVGAAEIPVTTPIVFNPGGLTCGANPGLPVTPEYSSPFKFTGKIYGVTVDVSGDLIKDSEAELRLVMARQ